MAIVSPNMTVMIRAAEKAARSLIRDFGEVENLQVSRKGPADFVSAADRRSEDIIYTELQKARPDWGFLMEERGEAGPKNAEYRWIVDPLDGTTNFLHGIPHWAISIALEQKGNIIAGLIYDPVKDEQFRAEKGSGAFLRSRRLRVSGRTDLQSMTIGGGSPMQTEIDSQYMRQLRAILAHTRGFRRLGAASLDMAYVAAGRLDGYWENSLKAWDVAAGAIIIREAGGFVSDPVSKEDPVFCGRIVAGNMAAQDELKKLLT